MIYGIKDLVNDGWVGLSNKPWSGKKEDAEVIIKLLSKRLDRPESEFQIGPMEDSADDGQWRKDKELEARHLSPEEIKEVLDDQPVKYAIRGGGQFVGDGKGPFLRDTKEELEALLEEIREYSGLDDLEIVEAPRGMIPARRGPLPISRGNFITKDINEAWENKDNDNEWDA